MKNIYKLLYLALIPVSCTVVNPVIQDDLILSSDNISFTKEGGTSKIGFKTTASSIEFITQSDASWLSIHSKSDTIYLQAAPNEFSERSTTLILHAGNTNRKVSIKQAQAVPSIIMGTEKDPAPKEIVLAKTGGEKVIRLSGFLGNITAKVVPATETWLKVDLDVERKEVRIFTEELNSGFAREAGVILENSGASKEIKVSQQGSAFYYFPKSIEKGSADPKIDVINYETQMGNVFVKSMNKDSYTYIYFDSSSSMYSGISYKFRENAISQGLNWVEVSLDFNYKNNDILNGFIENILAGQFVLVADNSTETHKEFSSADGERFVTMDLTGNNRSKVVFGREEQQPKEYPTFEKFPFSLDAVSHWNLEQVGAYEKTMGNNEPKFSSNGDYYYDREGGLYQLYYTLTDGTVSETGIGFSKADQYNKFLWLSGSKFKLTNEFKTLLESNGFKIKTANASEIICFNESRKLYLHVGYTLQPWGEYASLTLKTQ